MNTDPQSQKTVLITGAAGGIGRATVQLFTHIGWRVIGVDRAPYGEAFPQSGLFIRSDISIGENLETIFQQAHSFTGSLNALVNNAALQVAKPMLETSVAEWDAVMASNLRSVFLGVKLAYPLFEAAGGGAIVNVSSVHAVATSANIAAYAASKGGLLAPAARPGRPAHRADPRRGAPVAVRPGATARGRNGISSLHEGARAAVAVIRVVGRGERGSPAS